MKSNPNGNLSRLPIGTLLTSADSSVGSITILSTKIFYAGYKWSWVFSILLLTIGVYFWGDSNSVLNRIPHQEKVAYKDNSRLRFGFDCFEALQTLSRGQDITREEKRNKKYCIDIMAGFSVYLFVQCAVILTNFWESNA